MPRGLTKTYKCSEKKNIYIYKINKINKIIKIIKRNDYCLDRKKKKKKKTTYIISVQ